MKRFRFGQALLLLTTLVLVTGCAGLVDNDQNALDRGFPFEPGQVIGQTFVAQHGGLMGIDVWLAPYQPGEGRVRLHLLAGPAAGDDLAVAELPLAQVASDGFYRFNFPAQAYSFNRQYYAMLTMDGPGSFAYGAAAGDTYLNGALYRDGLPQDTQLRFRLVYDRWLRIADVARASLGGLALLLIAGLLFIVPGWALLAWLWHEHEMPLTVILTASGGISVALYALLFLWFDLIGVHPGVMFAIMPAAMGVAALTWRGRGVGLPRLRAGARAWSCSPELWPDLALLAIIALVFASRLIVVRTLAAPMWGDSVQHATITQLLIDNKGLFTSWEPYAPYATLSTHYGFSTAAAVLGWGTGMNGVRATLWMGQIMNGLAVLALYPLAVRLSKGNRWAGAAAVMAAGLISRTPAIYADWGRFAQLAGQTVLPVALWLLCGLLESPGATVGAMVLAGGTAAGMVLTYLRMPFYYAPFVVTWLAGYGLSHWRLDLRRWAVRFARLAALGAVIILLLLPWRSRLAGSTIETLTTAAAGISRLAYVRADYAVWADRTAYVPVILQVACTAAFIWMAARRDWTIAAVTGWAALLAALPAGQLINIPGTNMIQSSAILFALYIPAGILAGWLVGEMARLATSYLGRTVMPACAGALLIVAFTVLPRQLNVITPDTMLVTAPDARALSWIRNNTAQDARFLVEALPLDVYHSAVGGDAGWWVPLMAGRANTLPPQYAMLNEQPTQPGYTAEVANLVERLRASSPSSPEGRQALCHWGITHVFIGQGQGSTSWLGEPPLFRPADFAGSPYFREIYHQDRVHVFAFDRTACAEITR